LELAVINYALLFMLLVQTNEPEPPMVLKATIDGVTHDIEAGRTLQIKQNVPMSFALQIVPTGQRLFRYGGMSFQYPAEMRFETDHAPGCSNWSLLGRYADLDIYSTPLTARRFLEIYVENFVQETEDRQQRPKLQQSRLQLDSATVTTWQSRIQLTDDDFHEFFVVELPPREGEVRLLMFDVEYEGDSVSQESQTLKSTVLQSLKFEG